MIMLYLSILIFGVLFYQGAEDQGEKKVAIFVKSNGIHTDITMPVETYWYDWKNFIPIKDYPYNDTFNISIGWGDRGFFIDTPDTMYPYASYWGADYFYKAKGSYHLLNTCNSWTNGALKSAGLETALYGFFPDAIMKYRN